MAILFLRPKLKYPGSDDTLNIKVSTHSTLEKAVQQMLVYQSRGEEGVIVEGECLEIEPEMLRRCRDLEKTRLQRQDDERERAWYEQLKAKFEGTDEL